MKYTFYTLLAALSTLSDIGALWAVETRPYSPQTIGFHFLVVVALGPYLFPWRDFNLILEIISKALASSLTNDFSQECNCCVF